MVKRLCDACWQCLPKAAREFIERQFIVMSECEDYGAGYDQALIDIFGHHNLTSDTEPEEMLMVKKREVQNYYYTIVVNCEKERDIDDYASGEIQGAINTLYHLFGDKCLPDDGLLQPSVKVEGESVKVEPKFKDTYEQHQDAKVEEHRNLSQSSSIYDKSKDNQLKDNRKALYNALCELESASAKVRKALISLE